MKKNQADKLLELKTFVQQQYFRTLHKLKITQNEQERERFFLKKCSEIRIEIDKLTNNGNSHRSGDNLNSSQSLQLGQVKIHINLFQPDGNQMKDSEKEQSDVMDKINQKKPITPQSTNSLDIKLWNAFKELQTTNITNQSGISNQLVVMDWKQDEIKDSIETGKNEVLLKLDKILKFQDMTLEKPQDKIDISEMLAQAEKIQFETNQLSQTNIQIPEFDIHQMSSHFAPSQLLLYTQLDLSHASIISTQQSKNHKLRQSFNDIGEAHYTIITSENGKIVVGGNYKKLYQFSSELKELEVKDIDGWLWNGMAIEDQLYCCIGKQLQILDQNTLDPINSINTQSIVKKMLLIDDWLILGEQNGYLEIISISQQKTIFTTQLQYDNIYDIVKLNDEQYGFACNNGLFIVSITHNNDQIFCELNTEEFYFTDKCVLCVENVQQYLLIAGIYNNHQLQIVDRRSKSQKPIKQIGPFDGLYNVITKVLGYNEQSLPYLIVKDASNIKSIDTNTFDIVLATDCKYDRQYEKSSVVQKQIDNKLYLFTLTYNYQNIKQRGILQFEIDHFQ